jgi:hypothetical protein
LRNLILLCSHHHHVAHKPGWWLTFDGTTLAVHRPDGSILEPEHPRRERIRLTGMRGAAR